MMLLACERLANIEHHILNLQTEEISKASKGTTMNKTMNKSMWYVWQKFGMTMMLLNIVFSWLCHKP